MTKFLTFFAILASLILFSNASILILEEGTAEEDDWRQLSIELPTSIVDSKGVQTWPRPVWTRREGDELMNFPVLGSLICPDESDESVAARIGGVWVCVDIDDPSLPPEARRRRSRGLRATTGRVDPPTSCPENMAPAVWVAEGEWECGDPEGLIQAVNNPAREICHDTDLVVFDDANNWFECKPLNQIEFASTISTNDYRWQTPTTVRHIGSLASTSRVRAGNYTYFRWNNFAFSASTDTIAYDTTSPPQGINSGGATWIAYTISTTFVSISGSPPYEIFGYYPISPSISGSYKTTLESMAKGSLITGDNITFYPGFVVFSPNGNNAITYVGPKFNYSGTNSTNGWALVSMPTDTILDANTYPVVEILEGTNFYIGKSTSYDPNLILTISMWLLYIDPSGF